MRDDDQALSVAAEWGGRGAYGAFFFFIFFGGGDILTAESPVVSFFVVECYENDILWG